MQRWRITSEGGVNRFCVLQRSGKKESRRGQILTSPFSIIGESTFPFVSSVSACTAPTSPQTASSAFTSTSDSWTNALDKSRNPTPNQVDLFRKARHTQHLVTRITKAQSWVHSFFHTLKLAPNSIQSCIHSEVCKLCNNLGIWFDCCCDVSIYSRHFTAQIPKLAAQLFVEHIILGRNRLAVVKVFRSNAPSFRWWGQVNACLSPLWRCLEKRRNYALHERYVKDALTSSQVPASYSSK